MNNNHSLKTTESYRISQILKRKILRKHIIITNTNFWLKIAMLVLVSASMIFFAVVASGILFNTDVKHAIGLGKLVFVWPVIISGIVFVGELALLFFIHEKRKWIAANYTNNGYGNVQELKKLTLWSIFGYSLSLVFIICMFGAWFGFINGAYGNYDMIFKPTFPYHVAIFSDFRDIFIGLYSVMIAVEVAVIGSLIGIYFYNVKYKETLAELIPIASKEMARNNSL